MGLFAFWLQKTLYFMKFAFDGEKKLQSLANLNHVHQHG